MAGLKVALRRDLGPPAGMRWKKRGEGFLFHIIAPWRAADGGVLCESPVRPETSRIGGLTGLLHRHR